MTEVEGGFETSLGWFGVMWKMTGDQMTITLDVPSSTTRGTVVLPSQFRSRIVVNGMDKGRSADGQVELDGGKHTVVGFM